MLFFLLYTLWFFLYASQKIRNRKLFYLFCIMYLAIVYQRTNLYDPVYTFLFVFISRFSYGISKMDDKELFLIRQRKDNSLL